MTIVSINQVSMTELDVQNSSKVTEEFVDSPMAKEKLRTLQHMLLDPMPTHFDAQYAI